jgi:hypothetical protein
MMPMAAAMMVIILAIEIPLRFPRVMYGSVQ